MNRIHFKIETNIKVLNCLHRSEFGGSHRRVVLVANQMQKHAIETIVFYPKDKQCEYEQFLIKNKIQFIREILPPIRKSIYSILIFLATLPFVTAKLIKIINTINFDIVHVNGATNLQPVVAGLLAKRPVIWHWNDTLTPKWYIKIVCFILKNKNVTLVLATPYILEYYDINTLDYFILPAPVPPELENILSINQNKGKKSLRKELGLTNNVKLIGYVSHLLADKGAKEFTLSALNILKHDQSIHAVMVGGIFTGHERFADSIKKLVDNNFLSDRIHLIGYRSDVSEILRELDVFVFPSHSEACPIIVLQAMQAGIPIVATKVGDVTRMLDGVNAYIVEPKNISGLISGVREMLNLSDKEKQFIKKIMKEKVIKSYSLSVISQKHYELYNKKLVSS